MSATSDRESRLRTLLMSYFPMFIATLSLCASIFNGYLNLKFVDFIQRNTGRVEYMRTCKEIIDAYFQVKFRAGVINSNAARGSGADARPMSGDDIEGANAVNKFAALGTYLANLRDESVRKQYTEITEELRKIMSNAPRTAPGEFNRRFETADTMFTGLNDDCVKSAKDAM
jgi:hypothetical protein